MRCLPPLLTLYYFFSKKSIKTLDFFEILCYNLKMIVNINFWIGEVK